MSGLPPDIKLTTKQDYALALLATKATRIMLFGGSRSGKTFLIVLIMILTALWFPGCRQIILRRFRKDVKTKVWLDTLKKVMRLLKLKEGYDFVRNEQDLRVTFRNPDAGEGDNPFDMGSELWCDGLDDKERVEKILGAEYVRIFFNECSQMSYDSITTALTRLSQKIKGLIPKAFFDMNPPSPKHWTHRIFIEGIDPVKVKKHKKSKAKADIRLDRPDLYAWLKINPPDNAENLADNYIEDTLETMPERKRRRFLLGEFVKPEGAIYEKFDEEKHIISESDVPKKLEYYSKGTDFGLNMASVLVGISGDMYYVLKDHGAYNLTAAKFQSELTKEGWGDYKGFNYCDPAGGERLQSIAYSHKANNDVDAGIDFIVDLLEKDRIKFVDSCFGVLSEINDYVRDEEGRIVKENDHYMDALRYAIYSFIKPVPFKKSKPKSKPVTSGYRRKEF